MNVYYMFQYKICFSKLSVESSSGHRVDSVSQGIKLKLKVRCDLVGRDCFKFEKIVRSSTAALLLRTSQENLKRRFG